MGRAAVLMGLLSYSFVTVTLIADLGLPLHSYQLGLQAPEHSAMFEVSWCVGLYVTVLLFEFLPVPLEHFGLKRAMEVWRRWSGAYVAFAITLFVFLFRAIRSTRPRRRSIFGPWPGSSARKGIEPIILAIAAVTLSTMHQSSLGSLFLLMPDKLAAAVVVSGDADLLLPLLDRRRDRARGPRSRCGSRRAWHRPLRMRAARRDGPDHFLGAPGLPASSGSATWRSGGSSALRSPAVRWGLAFAVEVGLGGLVPLFLLSRAAVPRPAAVASRPARSWPSWEWSTTAPTSCSSCMNFTAGCRGGRPSTTRRRSSNGASPSG